MIGISESQILFFSGRWIWTTEAIDADVTFFTKIYEQLIWDISDLAHACLLTKVTLCKNNCNYMALTCCIFIFLGNSNDSCSLMLNCTSWLVCNKVPTYPATAWGNLEWPLRTSNGTLHKRIFGTHSALENLNRQMRCLAVWYCYVRADTVELWTI